MATDKNRIKKAIKEAFEREQGETENPANSVDRLSEAIAAAVIAEIKNITLTYRGGLVVPTGGGSVTGTLTTTIIS